MDSSDHAENGYLRVDFGRQLKMNLLVDPGQTEWLINIPQSLHCKEMTVM